MEKITNGKGTEETGYSINVKTDGDSKILSEGLFKNAKDNIPMSGERGHNKNSSMNRADRIAERAAMCMPAYLSEVFSEPHSIAPSRLASELLPWHVFVTDRGHSVVGILKQHEILVFDSDDTQKSFLDYALPIPVKSVMRGYEIRDGYVIACSSRLEYNQVFGLICPEEDNVDAFLFDERDKSKDCFESSPPSSKLVMMEVGGDIGEHFQRLFPYMTEGSFLEYNTADRSYSFFYTGPDISDEEAECFRKGKITAKILEPGVHHELPSCVFSTLLKIGSLGPIEAFFEPTRFDRSKWKEVAERAKGAKVVYFYCIDTKTHVWKALRLASMPKEWKRRLDRWWEWAANNTNADGRSITSAIDKWVKQDLMRLTTPELWERAQYVGRFGE